MSLLTVVALAPSLGGPLRGQGPAQQTQVHVVDCRLWNDPVAAFSPQSKSDKAMKDNVVRLAKTALARGIGIGQASNLMGYLQPAMDGTKSAMSSDPSLRRLVESYLAGESTLSDNVALMSAGLDTKCGDYRNATLSLALMGLVVTLEVGGTGVDRTEAALQVARRKVDWIPPDIVNALLGR